MMYSYSITNDTLNGQVDLAKLFQEILASAISIALDHIDANGDSLEIHFKGELTSPDITILTTAVADHDGIPLPVTELEIDADGRQIVRAAITNKGWAYIAACLDFTIGQVNGLSLKNHNGDDLALVSKKLYDANGAETVDPLLAVKTVVDVEFEHDIEMVAGRLYQANKTINNIYLHTIIAPDIPEAFGGSVILASGINLKYNDFFKTDGKAPKKFPYDPIYHTGKIRFVMEHGVSTNHDILVVLDLYREI